MHAVVLCGVMVVICYSGILQIFFKDQASALHVLPKLTLEHIVLTSYSKMKVKFATQVLSQSVAIALDEAGDNDVLETAKSSRMINSFFDCTNVRSRTEHIHKKNDFIKPYTSLNDERFEWLLNVFLVYLENWRKSTLEREGNYKSDARDKMFLSQ